MLTVQHRLAPMVLFYHCFEYISRGTLQFRGEIRSSGARAWVWVVVLTYWMKRILLLFGFGLFSVTQTHEPYSCQTSLSSQTECTSWSTDVHTTHNLMIWVCFQVPSYFSLKKLVLAATKYIISWSVLTLLLLTGIEISFCIYLFLSFALFSFHNYR